jgi:cephalosporin-C deacetylase-like acetyl esterase
MIEWDRRCWMMHSIGWSGAIALGASSGSPAIAQTTFGTLNRYPRMLHDWYVERVREIDRQHDIKIDQLNNKADAEQYVSTVRDKIRRCFGPFPERTPLHARVTGVVERDAYRIEKIIFDSRPSFPVTGNLYLPKNLSGPSPGVIGTCGHSSNGKAAEAYQSFAQGLARLGYICFIIDPIGQGERLQYTQDHQTSKIGVGVNEHLHAGNQQFLVGDFLGAWHAWDAIRALDYLLTRPEVDPKRVGVTGNSGGGTLTTWLCGLDDRWSMAAPACFVTSFRRNLENELPADTEQCPPQALALGLDHSDFLAALAPKPIIILAKERDYFDVRGTETAYRRLRKIYGLLGAPSNIAMFVGPTEHGYSQENREAMYSWFRHAAPTASNIKVELQTLQGVYHGDAKVDGIKEPALLVETDETLRCTVTGQVAEDTGRATAFSFTRERSRQLSGLRKNLQGETLKQSVRKALRLPTLPVDAPDYRIWQHLGTRGYASKSGVAYAIQTEAGIEAIAYQMTQQRRMSRPALSDKTALLYLPNDSSDEELRTETLLREWCQTQTLDVFTCDVRGVGESQPDTCGPNSFRKPYGSEYFYAIHGLMLDRPLLGQRVYDALRVLQWIESVGYPAVHLAGVGNGGLIGLFAALLSPIVKKVTLKNVPDSWSSIAESEYYEMKLANMLPNVLAEFDLPDCFRALDPKGLQRVQ